MTLNASGAISLAGTTAGQSIELELGGNGTTTISLNDANVRSLLGVASGAISLSNAYGKSSVRVPGGAVLVVPSAASGLRARGVAGYHNENVNYVDSGYTFINTYTTVNITTYANNVSRAYLGYFYAATTGVYYFAVTSDDGSYTWLGSEAVSGYTIGNCIINNGGSHGAQTIYSAAQYLTAGYFYPIRVLYGNGTGSSQLTIYYAVPGGGYTTDGSTTYYYNSVTGGH